jgi:hypothetical protein
MIYFAQLPTGTIKIGSSTNVGKRIADLERHYQQSVSLVRTMEGGLETEREIQKRFAHLRFDTRERRSGSKLEQFRPAADLMEFIGLPVLVSANPDAVEAVEPKTKGTQVPMRFEIPLPEYEELSRQARKIGLSRSAYANILVMKCVAARKEGGEK